MLPYRVKNPPESLPIATYCLIVINTIVFIATQRDGHLPMEVASTYGIFRGHITPITLISSMFLHGDPLHLIGNMLFLWIFGCAVEGRLRTPLFLFVYVASGIAGVFLHLGMLSIKLTQLPMIGASGAIMGLVGAALYMFPHAPVCFLYISVYRLNDYTIEWPLWGAALYYVFWDIFGAVLNFAGFGGTAHLAHLGGVIAAVLMCLMFQPPRDDEHVAEAKAALADGNDYSLLWRRQLEDLARAQPDNPKIALALLVRAYEEEGQAKPEHLAAFKRHVRANLADPDQSEAMAKAACFLISKNPDGLDPADYVRIAQAQLNLRNVYPARTIYEGVRKLPNVPDAEMETATYQLAQIYDQWFNLPEAAYALYYEVYQRWPMSPVVPSMTERMKQMYPAVQAASAARQFTSPQN